MACLLRAPALLTKRPLRLLLMALLLVFPFARVPAQTLGEGR